MINVDLRSNKPIYEQIIEQMKSAVLKGYLKPGDPIPSVRKMALDLSVTPGTVAKAYKELERQKVIETIRAKGTFIAEGIEMKPDTENIDKIKSDMKSLIVELKYMGLSEEEVATIAKDIYKDI